MNPTSFQYPTPPEPSPEKEDCHGLALGCKDECKGHAPEPKEQPFTEPIEEIVRLFWEHYVWENGEYRHEPEILEDFIRTQFPKYAAKEYDRGFDDGAAIEGGKPDDTLDAMVRDFCAVGWNIKSETRRRIQDYAAKERKETVEQIVRELESHTYEFSRTSKNAFIRNIRTKYGQN